MKTKTTPAESGTEKSQERLDHDYIMAMSSLMPETAVGELPMCAWVVCTAVLAVITLVLVGIG